MKLIGNYSKAIGAGTGAAMATAIVFMLRRAVPDMDEQTAASFKEVIIFVLSIALPMLSTYAAPPNIKN